MTPVGVGVQCNAMPVSRGEGDFQTLLKKDPYVKKYLDDAEIEVQFDLGYHLKHVDTIFKRVFGKAWSNSQDGLSSCETHRPAATLVSRIRSSHQLAASSLANFEFERTLAIY